MPSTKTTRSSVFCRLFRSATNDCLCQPFHWSIERLNSFRRLLLLQLILLVSSRYVRGVANVSEKCIVIDVRTQWRSQKFSTGSASICSIPFCPFPFSCPMRRPITQRNHISKNYVFSWQGVRTPLTPLVWLRHCQNMNPGYYDYCERKRLFTAYQRLTELNSSPARRFSMGAFTAHELTEHQPT